MKKRIIRGLSLIVVLFISLSCSKDDPSTTDGSSDNKTVNEWVYSVMEDYYLWYDEIPKKSTLNFENDPETFFESLLSDSDGKTINGSKLYFSRIEEDESSTKTVAGSDTYGFDFATYLTSSQKYYAWVLYVLPGSPADKAGIKRGDWILGKDSDSPNLSTYTPLISGSAASFLIGEIHDDGRTYGFTNLHSVNVSASEVIQASPILKDTVLIDGANKIGYLMYNAFDSGEDYKDKQYDDEMKEVFKSFKTAGVNEFVLDLRYNGGGLVSSAKLLSSLLAPTSALGNVFCKYTYNDKHTKSNSSESFYKKSDSEISDGNLNLKRLVVLVGSTTASASEAVINCLRPYMGTSNVYVVGGTTLGKTVGSVTYGEDKSYGWLLHPIVFRIYNKEDKADYADGITPDCSVNELVLGETLYDFGDPNDCLLKAGLSWIKNGQTKTQTDAATVFDGGLSFKGYSFEGRRTEGLILTEH